MDFYVLDSLVKKQYDHWMNLWRNLSSGEVFAHPEYAKQFAREQDRALCAVQQCSRGFILLPIIVRPLSFESWSEPGNEWSDAVSPYGYGGPFVEGDCELTSFWRYIQHWAMELKVVSAFFRFSPGDAYLEGFIGKVEECGNIIIRSLTEGKEEIWNDYKHAVRTCIRNAMNSGLTLEIDETGARLQEFSRIYFMTMDRRNAAKLYYFSEQFFRNLVTHQQGQFVFFHVLYKDIVIASKLVLISKKCLYPYLGGSDPNYFHLYPNQFLDHSIFTWGIDRGKKKCVLGGGYDGVKDGVFQYKKKFAPSGETPFFVGKCIFDRNTYDELCYKRRQTEVEDIQNECCNGYCFFPEYRRKND